jgi:cell division protein FtsQ
VIRLFGARNRRRAPERQMTLATGRLLRAGAAVLAVGGVCASAPAVVRAVQTHPYFALREVIVRGHRRVSEERIRALAGIAPGMSAWSVDADAAEERLQAEPWVRSAIVRRDLPHRVVIDVREHRAVAMLAPEDRKGSLYYVAGHGSIFAAVTPKEAADLPCLSGLRAAELETGDPAAARAVRRAVALLRITARMPGVGPVSEIVVDRTRGLTLLPVRPAVPIEIGWTGFATKLARLAPVMKQWAGRESDIAAVSLLFDDEVIVRTRAERRPAAPARKLRT